MKRFSGTKTGKIFRLIDTKMPPEGGKYYLFRNLGFVIENHTHHIFEIFHKIEHLIVG